ncbi:protein kilB [Actinophytocola gossypii]|uniref:protein kilB n=1 Tax=Actinophytocola gossypii TaxID=2812003 RepID=UPI0021A874E3|nr:protein kilB [Actinophytocola gossypii]
MSAVWTSVIAVAGTLAGGLVPVLVQARTARRERRENRREARGTDVLAAVTALVSALADHRRAMWVLEDRRLSGADAQAVADARATSHVTRSAVTAPWTTVSILAPALADAARAAARATFAMHDAPTLVELETRRQAALDGSDRLVSAAAEFFAAVGGVLDVTPGRVSAKSSWKESR